MSLLIGLYGVVAYGVFLCSFLYAIGFVENILVPKTIDIGLPSGASGEPLVMSLVINLLLLLVFAVQHSVMARPVFKRWWTRVVPVAAERSTYVLRASGALALVFAEWRPIRTTVWDVDDSPLGFAIEAVGVFGWALVLASTYMIDHFELFGVKQVWQRLVGSTAAPVEFKTALVYKRVRHPIYLGFLLAFWAAPTMSVGHLVFAATTSAYVLVGIWFEERDLVTMFGQRYVEYRRQAGMLLPRLGGGKPPRV